MRTMTLMRLGIILMAIGIGFYLFSRLLERDVRTFPRTQDEIYAEDIRHHIVFGSLVVLFDGLFLILFASILLVRERKVPGTAT